MFRTVIAGVAGFLCVNPSGVMADEKPLAALPESVREALESHRQDNRQIRMVTKDALIDAKKKLIVQMETALQVARSRGRPEDLEAVQSHLQTERDKLGRLLSPGPVEQTSDDEKVRWVNENYPDGKLRSRTPHVNRQARGVREELDPQGVVRARLGYQEGRLHGLCEYFSSDGRPVSEKNYLNGIPDGEEKTFHAGLYRRLSVERLWHEGRLHGEEREYDRSGHLIRRVPYTAGSRHGTEEYFQPVQNRPDRLVRQVFWEWGQNQGQMQYEYDPLNGRLVAQLRRDRQMRLSGLSRYFGEAGKMEKEVHYADDQPEGLADYFSPEGRLIGRERWQAGRKVEEIIRLPEAIR